MRPRDALGQRESQPETAIRSCFIRLVKALEDVRAIRCADAGAAVLHRHRDSDGIDRYADDDFRTWMRIFDRIVQQYEKEPPQRRPVTGNERRCLPRTPI